MSNMEKKITLEDLAAMVNRGFEETAKKAEVDQQFLGVDRQFHDVNERLDRIEHLNP